jgi:thioredoxin reductase
MTSPHLKTRSTGSAWTPINASRPSLLAGWRRFVETPTAHFELLSEKRWVALTGRDKEAYDEARLNYHCEMIIVATPASARSLGRAGC